MNTITEIQSTTYIELYIGGLETGIRVNDDEVSKRLDAATSEVFSEIEDLEKHLDPIGKREAELLRTAIDELRVQFALGRMEGAEKLEALEEKIEHGFQQTKDSLSQVKNLTSEETKTLNEKLHKNWRRLKAETSLVCLRLGLAEEKGEEKLASAKEEIFQDLKTIKKSAKKHTEEIAHDFSAWVQKTKKAVSKRTHKILDSMKKHL